MMWLCVRPCKRGRCDGSEVKFDENAVVLVDKQRQPIGTRERSEYRCFYIMGVLGTMARHLDTIIGPGVMLLYPLYASMRAIESPSTLDDQQWLTYWVLYSFMTLFELSTHKILAWFPIWGYLKLMFCVWLVLPMFNGAAYIYENYVRQYIKNIGTSNYSDEYKKVLHMMTFDARKAVERYNDRYGPDAFDRVVRAAEKEAKKR
ncbi:hypothetical protein JHK82_038636 [Glycine max]|nr:hypothetical protein JHK82_038636 [Glycine max]KAG5120698.1 hypothetical protein JHK84_039038 [Glycine max]